MYDWFMWCMGLYSGYDILWNVIWAVYFIAVGVIAFKLFNRDHVYAINKDSAYSDIFLMTIIIFVWPFLVFISPFILAYYVGGFIALKIRGK